MAKVIGPLNSMEASGKCGDTIYYRNQHGQIARPVPSYSDPSTASQVSWRDAMTYLQTAWCTDALITDALRGMWENFGKTYPVKDRFGKDIYITGRDWFIRTNIIRKRAGFGYHRAPNKQPACSLHQTVTFSQTTSGIYVNLDSALTGDDFLYISCVPNQSVLRNFMPRTSTDEFFIKSSDSLPYKLYNNADLSDDEKRYFFKFRLVDGSGRASAHQIDFLDCAKQYSEITLDCTYDGFMYGADPDTNFGLLNHVKIQDFGGSYCRGLFNFDLSSIPASATIRFAEVLLYTLLCNNPSSVSCHAMRTSWVGNEFTWNIAYVGLPWSSPGMASGTDYESSPLDTVSVTAVNEWFSWDVTSFIQDVVDSVKVMEGFAFFNLTASQDLYVRSQYYSPTTHCPKLYVEYSI
jgi:hypothetical protein